MKASGLVRHFLISPFPKSENWKQQKSTSSASALATRYELSMVAWHCGDTRPWQWARAPSAPGRGRRGSAPLPRGQGGTGWHRVASGQGWLQCRNTTGRGAGAARGCTHLPGDVPLQALGWCQPRVGVPHAVPPLGVAQLEFVCRQHELGGGRD